MTNKNKKQKKTTIPDKDGHYDIDGVSYKNEIIHEHIKGRIGPSNLTAKAAYNKNHHIKVNMKVNHNLMMYDFTENIYNNLSVIQGALIKQDF